MPQARTHASVLRAGRVDEQMGGRSVEVPQTSPPTQKTAMLVQESPDQSPDVGDGRCRAMTMAPGAAVLGSLRFAAFGSTGRP
jgi:hypothetical protein